MPDYLGASIRKALGSLSGVYVGIEWALDLLRENLRSSLDAAHKMCGQRNAQALAILVHDTIKLDEPALLGTTIHRDSLYARACLTRLREDNPNAAAFVPTLKRGDMAAIDYLPVHRVAGVAEAIESAGATLLYLPPQT